MQKTGSKQIPDHLLLLASLVLEMVNNILGELFGEQLMPEKFKKKLVNYPLLTDSKWGFALGI